MNNLVQSKKILDSHAVIAWDIDETLINGTFSDTWRKYVLDNPEKYHYLVTFRSSDDLITIWNELKTNSNPITKNLISGILYLPDNIRNLSNSLPKSLRYLSHNTVVDDQIKLILNENNIEWDYVKNILKKVGYWKGFACTNIGAGVLVDDLEHVVREGCEFHGIDFVNSQP